MASFLIVVIVAISGRFGSQGALPFLLSLYATSGSKDTRLQDLVH